MDRDDVQVGRILSRREILATFGAAGAGLLYPSVAALGDRRGPSTASGGGPWPSCIVRPAQMEGPYFVEERLNRSDIRSDPAESVPRPGAPLRLLFRVSRMDGASCAPLAGAVVDLWQCDAAGVYSDVKDIDGRFNTVGQKFLRGHQVTGAQGTAEFLTIYPGWYEGRTVHLHFKIRTDPGAGRGYEFVSQLYFDDRLTDRMMASAPYAGKSGQRVRNERDGIFRRGGRDLMLDVSPDGAGHAASFDIGLQM